MSSPLPTPRQSAGSRTTTLSVATVVAVGFAVLLAQVGVAVPATLNGTFQTVLHPTGASQLDWISDAILLPIAALELTFGVLGDLFGRKKLLVIGSLILLVGELISSTSSGVVQMYFGQFIAGVGSATLFPTTLAIIASGSNNHINRSKMIALWAALLSLGNLIAPLLGGWAGTYANWRLAFVIIAILALIVAAISFFLAEDSRSPEGRSLDIPGQITIGLGLFAVLYGVIEGPTAGWGSPTIITSFVVAAVLIVAFVVIETKVASPLLRMDLFKNRSFALASGVTVFGMFSFLGTAYGISIWMEVIQHQTPIRTSVAFLLISGLSVPLLPLTSFLLTRLQSRWVLSLGFLLMGIGQVLASKMTESDTSLTAIIIPMGLVGIGFAFAVASVTATVVNTVPPQLAGMAAATTSMVRDFGFALGPAVVGAFALGKAGGLFNTAINGVAGVPAALKGAMMGAGPMAVNSVPPSVAISKGAPQAVTALTSGYSTGFLIVGIVALACAVVTVLFLGGRSEVETEIAMDEQGESAVVA